MINLDPETIKSTLEWIALAIQFWTLAGSVRKVPPDEEVDPKQEQEESEEPH